MKVVIAGYGVEGKASYEYYAARGDEVAIADERTELDAVPTGATTILGHEAFSRLADYDLIIRAPSVSPAKLPYGSKVWSATNEFFAECPAPIIGVTGTKGKGTTCSLIVSILRAAGRTVHLVGNIGIPALDVLSDIKADDIVVFELSSFQLWDIQKSPHVAVVLMIEPDHLDVHGDLDDYLAAKSNIVKYQTAGDVVVFNAENEYALQIAATTPAERIEYPFDISDFETSLQIPGRHNIENVSAAIAAVREYAIDDSTIRQGLERFEGLPHRLRFVREVGGVKYYDDNYSSAPSATLAAVKSFDAPEILIAGGYDKGINLAELARELSRRTNIKHIVLIGQTGLRIRGYLEQNGYDDVTLLEGTPTMREIVDRAREIAKLGDIVVMSPACASFDMFKNFADRGDQFIAAVEAL